MAGNLRDAGVARLRPDLAKTVIPRSYRGRNGHTDRDARLDFGPDFLTRGRHLGLTAFPGTGSNFDQHYFSFMFPFLPNNIQ
jgi:hypothetical protein